MADEKSISALLEEDRLFEPSAEFVKQANISDPAIYEKAANEYEGYWENWAKELTWFKPWTQVVDWSNPPFAKWFLNGKLNVSYNCLDRHLEKYGDKAAIIFEGEPGDSKTYTYKELHAEVCKFANVLKGQGVKKGDKVCIYMPMIPQLPIAMLACARIGAAHSIVFGGFSAESLRDRVNDAQTKYVITTDGGYRRGKPSALKPIVDEALKETPCVEKVIVYKRCGDQLNVNMTAGRDLWWDELEKGVSTDCPAEEMDAEDMLFILYTSGSTGKPKGIVHTTGGYLTGVYATYKWVFDIKDSDIYWCTADIGWVTGHSYIVYGPLANHATSVMYEGTPDYPDKDRFWKIIEKHKATILYTAPTAIRAFMKWGDEYPARCDISSLRLLGSVGEPINPEAWMWYKEHIGRNNCPIVDTWWQTETGAIMITPLPGIIATKPGSATKPFPGIIAEVLDEDGNIVKEGGGNLVVMKPWPAMVRTILNDNERFTSQYWRRFPNLYFTGDGAKRDKDGYIWLLGRVDDVINVSGHRLSTMEIESALVEHPAVAEAAVIGKAHDLKGQAISAFVIVREGFKKDDSLVDELKKFVRTKIGPIATPDDVIITAELPKTRSGKIMRRLLRDVAEGRALGDTTTLADPAVVASLKDKYEKQEG